jgi:hypothetical protein
MAAKSHDRVLAWHGVSLRARKGGAGNTTDRWQDKEARCALAVGCLISRGYVTNSRCAPEKRSLRNQRFINLYSTFARCVGSRP